MPRKYSIHGHLSCRGTPAPFVPAIWLQSNQISMNIKAWFHRNVLSGLDKIIQKYNKLYRPLWLSACIWPSVYQPPRLAWNITPLVYSPRDVFLLFCFFLNRVRYIFLCLHLNVICGKKLITGQVWNTVGLGLIETNSLGFLNWPRNCHLERDLGGKIY